MLSRLALVLLFLTGVGLYLAWTTGIGFTIPIEKAVQADLGAAASPSPRSSSYSIGLRPRDAAAFFAVFRAVARSFLSANSSAAFTVASVTSRPRARWSPASPVKPGSLSRRL